MANEYGNYCVWDALFPTNTALSNGNMTAVVPNADNIIGTIAVSSGKWYYEIEWDAGTSLSPGFANKGVKPDPGGATAYADQWTIRTYNAGSGDGRYYTETDTGSVLGTFSLGDVLGFAIDFDNDAVWVHQNGTWLNSATISEVQAGTTTNAVWTGELSGKTIHPLAYADSGTNGTGILNCGQIAFNTAIPAGFKTLNTANLPTPAIIDPSDHFFSTVVTHDGSSTASTCSFNLDTYEWLAIIKNVDNTEIWYWIDSLKGVTKYQDSSTGNAGVTNSNVLTVSGTTFTLGSTLLVDDYLVEFHKAGLASATASNTDGTINTTSTSANTTSGFSILLYTGTGANATVGHGLEVAPDMVIVWNSSQNGDIPVGHVGLDGFTKNLRLQGNNRLATTATYFNNTNPTATVTAIGTSSDVNGSSGVIVHYSWHSVSGYSAFGKYGGLDVDGTPTNNFDGPMINTGFAPASILIKGISADTNWQWSTEATDPAQGNPNTGFLVANTTAAPVTNTTPWDFLSNGAKVRVTSDAQSISDRTYIYCMWGGTPIQGDGKTNQGRAK